MDWMTDPKHWHKRRDEAMTRARLCKKATPPEGGWLLERMLGFDSVEYWVKRARRAHRIAMGFEPLIDNFYVQNGNTAVQGPLYVGGNDHGAD